MTDVVLEEISQPIFGITGRHYRRLASQGFVPFPIRGKIQFLSAAKALIEYYRRMGEKTSTNLEHEKRLKVQVERKLKELTLLVEMKELIPRSEILTEFLQRINIVRSGLITLSRSLSKKLPGENARAMGEIIKGEVFRFLEKMSLSRIKKIKGGKENE